MEPFVTIVNGFQALTIVAKSHILDFPSVQESTSDCSNSKLHNIVVSNQNMYSFYEYYLFVISFSHHILLNIIIMREYCQRYNKYNN